METLLESLDTNRTALLPQIKILRESHLISKDKREDMYELTTIGKLIVDEMEHFLLTAEMFGGDYDFMGTHYIDFIPEHLLKRLPELGPYDVVDISINDFFDMDQDLFDDSVRSHYWFEITSTLHPQFHDFYVKMTDYVTDVAIIMTQEVYEKAKTDYYDEFRELIDLDLISLYIYPEDLRFISFMMSGESIKFRLFTEKMHPDNQRLIFTGPEVLEWGKEFFDHYRKRSTPIVEIL